MPSPAYLYASTRGCRRLSFVGGLVLGRRFGDFLSASLSLVSFPPMPSNSASKAVRGDPADSGADK